MVKSSPVLSQTSLSQMVCYVSVFETPLTPEYGSMVALMLLRLVYDVKCDKCEHHVKAIFQLRSQQFCNVMN